MANTNIVEQVHTLYSNMMSFLDATKVELGKTAKKVIGIIGISLTCILILASVVEGILGYYGHSNVFNGSPGSEVAIPPGLSGATDVAFTTAVGVMVFIVIPVAWGVGVFLAGHYTLLAMKETLREPKVVKAIWAVVGSWGLPLLAGVVAVFINSRSYFPFSQFIFSPPVFSFAVASVLNLLFPPLKKPHILYLQGLIDIVSAGYSGTLAGILTFFYRIITSSTDITVITHTTQTSGLWGAAFAFLALGFFTGMRGFFKVFFDSKEEATPALSLNAKGSVKKGFKGLSFQGCFVVLACLILILACTFTFIIPNFFVGTPQLATSYRGTLTQTGRKGDVIFTLSSIQEGQLGSVATYGNIAGNATFSPEIINNGSFWGNVRSDKTMDFSIGNFFFTANLVNSVKSLSGTYSEQITNPTNHTVTVGASGVWQLSATS